MSLINIAVAFVSYLLLMILVGANSKIVRNSLLVAALVLTYLFTFLNGTAEFIPGLMIGHSIALVIGLLVYRSIDKQVKEAESQQ